MAAELQVAYRASALEPLNSIGCWILVLYLAATVISHLLNALLTSALPQTGPIIDTLVLLTKKKLLKFLFYGACHLY